MGKSPDAFRTITEVSDWLETPTHVLRFWETKFPSLKPVKRAGGRRYYRPGDMALLAGIKALLHEQGMSIKGVQKLLRERGPRHVAGQSPLPWDAETMDAVAWEPPEAPVRDAAPPPAPDGADDGMAGDGAGDGAGEAEDFDLPPPPAEPEGEEALTFLDAVLAGTARRLREGAPMAEGEPDDEPPEVIPFPEAPRATPAAGRAPVNGAAAGSRPCERLLHLLTGADRSLLRARADRLAPLVARLGAVRGDRPDPSSGPLRARGESL